MSLNRYGFLIKQYLQINESERYQELLKAGILDEVIEKRQQEVMEHRNKLELEYRNQIERELEDVMYKPL